jgi:hypothetical protein
VVAGGQGTCLFRGLNSNTRTWPCQHWGGCTSQFVRNEKTKSKQWNKIIWFACLIKTALPNFDVDQWLGIVDLIIWLLSPKCLYLQMAHVQYFNILFFKEKLHLIISNYNIICNVFQTLKRCSVSSQSIFHNSLF